MTNSYSFYLERIDCPVCLSKHTIEIFKTGWEHTTLKELARKRGYDLEVVKEKEYTIKECINCGLIYQKYIPNTKLTDLIYNKWLSRNRNPTNNLESIPYKKSKSIFYISEINQLMGLFNNPKLKVLDFGMGWGGWCKAAQLMGLAAYGTEICKRQIEFCRGHGIEIIKWDEIPGMDFDFINSEQVFEHLENPHNVLKHLLSGLKDNGIIKISVPNARRAKRYLSENITIDLFLKKGKSSSLNSIEPLQHINGFIEISLKKMAQKQNMTILNKPFGNYYKNSIGDYSNGSIFKAMVKRVLSIDQKSTYVLLKRSK